jgi:hypothetical protein
MSSIQGVGPASSPAWRPTPVQRSAPGSETPPEGYLPSTQQVLSQLTPSDRAQIAAATGYHLSTSGEITNPGGLPPWSFILNIAEKRSADRSDEGPSQSHVDVVV